MQGVSTVRHFEGTARHEGYARFHETHRQDAFAFDNVGRGSIAPQPWECLLPRSCGVLGRSGCPDVRCNSSNPHLRWQGLCPSAWTCSFSLAADVAVDLFENGHHQSRPNIFPLDTGSHGTQWNIIGDRCVIGVGPCYLIEHSELVCQKQPFLGVLEAESFFHTQVP